MESGRMEKLFLEMSNASSFDMRLRDNASRQAHGPPTFSHIMFMHNRSGCPGILSNVAVSRNLKASDKLVAFVRCTLTHMLRRSENTGDQHNEMCRCRLVSSTLALLHCIA